MIKYLIMDVDGTLTDGKIYIGPDGETMKAFSVKDGYAISFILKSRSIVPIIITARNSDIVQRRCEELGITKIYQGKMDKLATLTEIVGASNLKYCAYFGDDILDTKCMRSIREAGGIVGCPADSVKEVKAIANYICISKAGECALREFAEWLTSNKIDEAALAERVNKAVEYLRKLSVTKTDVGKYIVNDSFYYYVQYYETLRDENCNLESHRKFVDIQIMIEGSEAMDLVDISRLTAKQEYNDEKDVMFWKAPLRMARTTLRAGDFIILYPENAHRGAVQIGEPGKVLKIVGKVRVNN